jgi:hypothetical protein
MYVPQSVAPIPDVEELASSLVESGDLTEGEMFLIVPSVLESMIADSPNGFFSGAIGVDPTFASADSPADAVGGTFQLNSTFTPSQGGIPEDLTFWVYGSTNGLVASGPVSPVGSFSVNLADIPSGKNLYLVTFSSPTPAAPARRQRSLSTSITTAMSLWVERTTVAPTSAPSTGPSITPSMSTSQVPTPLASARPTTNPTDPPGSSALTLISSKEALSLLGLSVALFMYFAC